MESPQVLRAAVRQLDHARRHAKNNDEAQQNDVAWGKIFEAERHAQLVSRFMLMSDAARNHAARLESYGRLAQAGRQYEEAQRLFDIAQRHEKASEECQAEGDKLSADIRRGRPRGNGGGNNRPRQPAPPTATPTPPPGRTGTTP